MGFPLYSFIKFFIIFQPTLPHLSTKEDIFSVVCFILLRRGFISNDALGQSSDPRKEQPGRRPQTLRKDQLVLPSPETSCWSNLPLTEGFLVYNVFVILPDSHIHCGEFRLGNECPLLSRCIDKSICVHSMSQSILESILMK